MMETLLLEHQFFLLLKVNSIGSNIYWQRQFDVTSEDLNLENLRNGSPCNAL